MNGREIKMPSTVVQAALGSAYVLVVLLPVAAGMLSPSWRQQDGTGKLVSALVLTAYSLLSFQPVLAGRLKLLDRQFGLDLVYIFHKTMGMIAATLQLSLLAVVLATPERDVPLPAWIATGLIAVLGVTALIHKELGLTYESWRRLHNMLFLAVFLAAFLQTWPTAAALGHGPVTGVILLQAALAMAVYVRHRFLGPATRRTMLYRVQSVIEEARNVWTLTFEPPEHRERFVFLPGQFQFITFDGGKGEEHPFTISSSPTGGRTHASTIKGSGDFTRTVGQVRPGDLVGIQAAFGRFSHVLVPDERRLVFIAGGIGITPFMSMLRYMRDTGEGRDVVLIYANRSEEDIVFRAELDRISAGRAPRLRVVHVLDAPGPAWTGERGRIDRALIERSADDLGSRLFYLCGPPPMMSALAAMLIDAGVPGNRILTERFAL